MAKRKHQGSGNPRNRPVSGQAVEPWIYGIHPVLAALGNPARQIDTLFVTAEVRDRIGESLPGGAPAPSIVTRAELDRRLPPGAVHQGIAVQAEPLPPADLDVLLSGLSGAAPALLVVLDQITDPQNAGAILRAAAAFGAKALITTDRHAPPASGALAKAAAGALEAVPMVRVGNLVRALEALKSQGFWCIGLDGRAEKSIAEADPGPRVALVLGAEGAGLRRLTRENCDLVARIPIADAVESLNVAAAAAIALYEVTKPDPR